MAYECLTGQLPFDRNLPTFRQMMAKVKGDVLDPQRFNPQLGNETRAALLTGLHLDPLRRPRSASELCRLLARRDESADKLRAAAADKRRIVFVSYSHKDKEWLERIRVHLKPVERESIELWDDTRIKAGMHWREAISLALDQASAAVLLVSANFLASDFCMDQEVMRLLERARDNGVRILPVIISPCQFANTHLAAFQAVNPPSRTLKEMRRPEQERVLTALAAAVADSVG